MALNYTFSMIKPVAMKQNFAGSILGIINEHGFRIKALRMLRMTHIQAEAFYNIHREKPFFSELTDFMSSGPVIVMILEKENAVLEFRDLIGNTDPSKAAPGTIRSLFAESMAHNAVHGSDSDENAIKEAAFFFSEFDRY